MKCKVMSVFFSKLQMLLEEDRSTRAKIPVIFQQLMSPHTRKVDMAIQPGLTMLSWTSLNLQSYFTTIKVALRDLSLLIKQVCASCMLCVCNSFASKFLLLSAWASVMELLHQCRPPAHLLHHNKHVTHNYNLV